MKNEYSKTFEELKYMNMFYELKSMFPKDAYYFQEIISGFNYTILEELNYIDNNKDEFKIKDWIDYYKRISDNEILVLNIFRNHKPPVEVIDFMVEDLLSKTNASTFKYRDILNEALFHQVSPHLQNRIFSFDPINTVYYIGTNIKSIEPSIVDNFCKFIIDNIELYSDNDYLFQLNRNLSALFNNISSREVFDELLNHISLDPKTESIRHHIINSDFLDVNNKEDAKIIDQLFFDGCQYHMIKKFTPEITNYFKDNFTDIGDASSFSDNDKFELITDLIIYENLPASLEYDLAMKLTDTPMHSLSNHSSKLFINLLKHSKNETILNNIKDLQLHLQREILQSNYNIPREIYDEISKSYFDKLISKIKAKLSFDADNIKLHCLKDISLRTTFRDEDYNCIIGDENDNTKELTSLKDQLLRNICKSFYTPKHILEKIIDKTDTFLRSTECKGNMQEPINKALLMSMHLNAMFNFYAKLNLARMDNLITDNQCSCYYKCCDKAYSNIGLPFDTKFFCEQYDCSLFLENHLDIKTTLEYEKMIATLNEIFASNDDSYISKMNKDFLLHASEVTEHFFNSQYLVTNKNVATYSDNQLLMANNNFKLLSTAGTSFSFKNLDRLTFYIDLPKTCEHFYNIQRELTNRKLIEPSPPSTFKENYIPEK